MDGRSYRNHPVFILPPTCWLGSQTTSTESSRNSVLKMLALWNRLCRLLKGSCTKGRTSMFENPLGAEYFVERLDKGDPTGSRRLNCALLLMSGGKRYRCVIFTLLIFTACARSSHFPGASK